jgi:hypothetical protein
MALYTSTGFLISYSNIYLEASRNARFWVAEGLLDE